MATGFHVSKVEEDCSKKLEKIHILLGNTWKYCTRHRFWNHASETAVGEASMRRDVGLYIYYQEKMRCTSFSLDITQCSRTEFLTKYHTSESSYWRFVCSINCGAGNIQRELPRYDLWNECVSSLFSECSSIIRGVIFSLTNSHTLIAKSFPNKR